jgi:hypothetical protein
MNDFYILDDKGNKHPEGTIGVSFDIEEYVDENGEKKFRAQDDSAKFVKLTDAKSAE